MIDRCSTDVFINEQAYELINEWKYVLDIVSPSYQGASTLVGKGLYIESKNLVYFK